MIEDKESPPSSKKLSSILISSIFNKSFNKDINLKSISFLGNTISDFAFKTFGSGKRLISTLPLALIGKFSKLIKYAGIA